MQTHNQSTIEHHLSDIQTNISRIEEMMTGKNAEDMKTDYQLEYAVMRAFELIGEACIRIPEEIRNQCPQVEWRKIIAFRNFLIHVII